MMVGYLPNWLSPFLGAEYFTNCSNHLMGKNEKNYFCIDCVEGPLCHIELLEEHSQHKTLQVRRASHVNAVRISDIHKLIDVSDIQSYVINGAKIVFLLSRPQQKLVKEARHWCTSCGRTIADPVKYCSISCKLAGLIPVHTSTISKHWDRPHMFSTKSEASDSHSFEPSTPPLRRARKEEIIDQPPAKRPRLVFAWKLKLGPEEDASPTLAFPSIPKPGSSLSPIGDKQHPGVSVSCRNESRSLRIRGRKGMPRRSPFF